LKSGRARLLAGRAAGACYQDRVRYENRRLDIIRQRDAHGGVSMLLIIFMVITPMLTKGAQVELVRRTPSP
jgi:hypothetical protein